MLHNGGEGREMEGRVKQGQDLKCTQGSPDLTAARSVFKGGKTLFRAFRSWGVKHAEVPTETFSKYSEYPEELHDNPTHFACPFRPVIGTAQIPFLDTDAFYPLPLS